MKSFSLSLLATLSALALAAVGPAAPLKDTPGVYHDSFDGKFALHWKVVRPDADHVSFRKVPGALVITTQRGTIHGKEKEDALSEGTQAKNLHLLDNPLPKDADWVATTCVSGLVPETAYHQAGLIVYEDDDNYLKWGYEFDWSKGMGQRFLLVAEKDGAPVHDVPAANASGLTKYWLRIRKRGGKYAYDWSPDGKEWQAGGERSWDGSPRRIGLIAKNGGNKDAAGLDAAFEFFELRAAAGKK